MESTGRIATLESVPESSTFLFRVRDRDASETREALLVRDGEGVAGWLNTCQHFTHVALDKGDGATMRGDEIVCENHGAYFEADSGRCTFGPCEGAYLRDVETTVADGDVYLTDDDYEFVGVGPLETDAADRTSRSNVEF
ncbi:Rieske (2Fe-2S) protein [Natrononativus amylolyticus]|uniref:Rieske (2Fe-2S) protein n=1 Tax=Natrononativus amylolyticus TaxID=2963434 RepID=UPI0020CC9930|nr:Rieske 2Fe-2S domain-containing protein [Natrononativus amylolyticus]